MGASGGKMTADGREKGIMLIIYDIAALMVAIKTSERLADVYGLSMSALAKPSPVLIEEAWQYSQSASFALDTNLPRIFVSDTVQPLTKSASPTTKNASPTYVYCGVGHRDHKFLETAKKHIAVEEELLFANGGDDTKQAIYYTLKRQEEQSLPKDEISQMKLDASALKAGLDALERMEFLSSIHDEDADDDGFADDAMGLTRILRKLHRQTTLAMPKEADDPQQTKSQTGATPRLACTAMAVELAQQLKKDHFGSIFQLRQRPRYGSTRTLSP
eukprot:2804995-Pyramimonas_sp.AAC.1